MSRLRACARNGCPLAGAWRVSILVWADGTNRENGVPKEILTSYVVCTAHRDDGKYPDLVDNALMRRVGTELREEGMPPADWRTAEWKYTPVAGKTN